MERDDVAIDQVGIGRDRQRPRRLCRARHANDSHGAGNNH
jgi:hypothetical protein